MGEARRRSQQGLKSRKKRKTSDKSPRIVAWFPVTQLQRDQFIQFTIRGGWIGISILVLLWVTVRFIGPAAGWWVPADIR